MALHTDNNDNGKVLKKVVGDYLEVQEEAINETTIINGQLPDVIFAYLSRRYGKCHSFTFGELEEIFGIKTEKRND